MADSIKLNIFTGNFDIVGGSGSAAVKYSQVFNATTDWGSPSGGKYSITVTAATHGAGVIPNIAILELVSPGVFEQVFVDTVEISSSGDITIFVLEVPDLRFEGKLIIS